MKNHMRMQLSSYQGFEAEYEVRGISVIHLLKFQNYLVRS